MARTVFYLVLCVGALSACGQSGSGAEEPGEDVDVFSDQASVPDLVAWDSAIPEGTTLLKVYVAGESIERRNRFEEPPFLADGSLNERGGGEERNDNEEYGWMVPMADRLRLRAPDLAFEYVGSDIWADADDMDYSGSYPSTTPGHTSAISGTDIPSWLEQRDEELAQKQFCYHVAFASRGGNDFGNDNDGEYQAALANLVLKLDAGSNCVEHPLIYVTAHMPDDQRDFTIPDAEYGQLQKHRFSVRVEQVVKRLTAEHPAVRVAFVDLFTPFLENQPTLAFPNERWSEGGVLDYAKISRTNDSMHPRRLACIYAGELAADALDLDALRAVAR